MTLAAVVLAAGAARRFGGGKLAALYKGEPLLHHAIRAALAAPVERVIVVCAPDLDIGDWPDDRVERLPLNSPELSATLKAGLSLVGDADGAFVFLGDMPLVPHDLAGRLSAALGTNFAVQPVQNGKPGHPVLLSRRAIAALDESSGDHGAASLLRGRDDVLRIEVDDPGIMIDVDKAEDLARLNALAADSGELRAP